MAQDLRRPPPSASPTLPPPAECPSEFRRRCRSGSWDDSEFKSRPVPLPIALPTDISAAVAAAVTSISIPGVPLPAPQSHSPPPASFRIRRSLCCLRRLRHEVSPDRSPAVSADTAEGTPRRELASSATSLPPPSDADDETSPLPLLSPLPTKDSTPRWMDPYPHRRCPSPAAAADGGSSSAASASEVAAPPPSLSKARSSMPHGSQAGSNSRPSTKREV